MRRTSAVPASEKAVGVLVKPLQCKAERFESAVNREECILRRRLGTVAAGGDVRPWKYVEGQPDAHEWMACCLNRATLVGLLTEVLDLGAGAGAVYTCSGKLVVGVAISPWALARCEAGALLFMDEGVGGADEGAATLRGAARRCLARADVVELAADIGGRLCFAPVMARGRAIGAIGYQYGRPLEVVAAEEELPAFVDLIAKNRLFTLVHLLGEIVERLQVEEDLRQQQKYLEDAILERTSALELANAKLQEEIRDRRRAEELKDEFVSTVSHELRTPLAITKESIALLQEGIPGTINAKQGKVLSAAHRNIERLARIINDLLDISKIEAGKMEVVKGRVDFVQLADGVVRSFESKVQQKGLSLDTDWPVEVCEVLGDADRIVQVLTNLINNAIKFTKEGGLRVSARSGDGELVCVVEDSGVGLSPEEFPRVFEKFTQFGRVDGAGEKGTGLGLAIVKQIVALHRGRIWVESAIPRGCRFLFTLPLFSDAALLHEAIETAMEAARVSQESLTLLLFDFRPCGPLDEALSDRLVAAGVGRLTEMENFVRSSDRMVVRNQRQVVLLARITPDQIAGLYRRWKAQVDLCFHAVEPSLDVALGCGYAEYPSNGETVEELLAHADATLAQAEGG